MHKNDESFRRSRRIHGRDYSFSGENDAPHGPASGNRKENSLPTIKKLRQINEGLEGVSERLKQNQTLNIGGKVDPMLSRKQKRRRQAGQRNAKSYDIYTSKYKEFLANRHLYALHTNKYSNDQNPISAKSFQNNQKRHRSSQNTPYLYSNNKIRQNATDQLLFKDTVDELDPMNPNQNIGQHQSFFQKYKAKLEKNSKEKYLKNKLMPSIFENKMSNSTNRLINSIIQSRKEPSNVKVSSKPKKIYPQHFNSDQLKLAQKLVKQLIVGSERLSETKIEILTKLIINGLNMSKKVSKFDLKYTPQSIQLKTPNPSKFFKFSKIHEFLHFR